ncbi:hypothetical protein RI056_06085 [Komagataeibacter nataicola]|uniref:hypothetical protein n=1 Tax=Komagataeibacter nataicola TaxID=265960 RepID=UPI0028A76A20|nr:hypothetical protein [Komagataeibacter nataicola]WNM09515.1 hypothetical protein RI056_06085 [Komagataeibacter nataicola]
MAAGRADGRVAHGGRGCFIANRHGILPSGLQGGGKALYVRPLRASIEFTPVQHHTMSFQALILSCFVHAYRWEWTPCSATAAQNAAMFQETFAFAKRFMYEEDRRYDP